MSLMARNILKGLSSSCTVPWISLSAHSEWLVNIDVLSRASRTVLGTEVPYLFTKLHSYHSITFLSLLQRNTVTQSSVRCHVEWIGCVIQFSWYKSGIKESICLLGHVKSFAPWGYKRIRSGRRRLHSNSPCRKATGNEWSRPRAALWNLWDVMLQ